jgi:hypothetical protein
MTATQQLMTAEDLLRIPDDGFRYELIRGELRKSPSRSPLTAWAIKTATASLHNPSDRAPVTRAGFTLTTVDQ